MFRYSFSLLILVVLTANVYALSGSGTQADPWLIQSLSDFNVFAAEEEYWDDYTRLETDIELTEISYTTAVIAPDIDDSDEDFNGTPFTGEFNGNDHKIINLTIDTQGDDKNDLGLFGSVAAGAVVANIGLENVAVTGSGNQVYLEFTGDFGALVGVNSGVIQNCWVNSSITGGNYSEDIGGLCGWNRSTGSISMCYAIGSVRGGVNSGGIGGLCGSNDGSITNCWASSSVKGRNSLGGLCGFLDGGNITNSYSTSLVEGTVEYLGGLIGERNGGIVTNCFWDTQTSGMSTSNGGTGKTTAEMKQKSTFTNWDFDVIWKIEENTTYPYLTPETPETMLAGLALFIMDEVDDSGDIAPELEGSLLVKIDAALAALDRGNPNDAKVAMNDLKALINQVEAQVNKKITPEAADTIKQQASAVITILSS